MKKILFSLSMILIYFVSSAHMGILNTSDINNFTEADYDVALAKSKIENKLVFLDFHAKWCTPCKWMEQTTLNDPKVKKVLSEKYVTIKIDIDDFDGFDLKQRYEVQTLPTLIFLNSNGNIIERLDETVGTEKFLKMIEKQSANVKPVIHPSNTSPFAEKESYTTKKKTIRKEDDNSKSIHKKSYSDKSTPHKNETNIVRNHITLQMGSFSSRINALHKKQALEKMSNLPIKIVQETKDGKSKYNVNLGQFHSLDAAKRYKFKIKRKYKVVGIIK